MDNGATLPGNLDADFLKWTGIAAMTADHIGRFLLPDQIWLQVVGRLAFPLFAWSLVLGHHRTRDVGRYLLRLAILAVVAQPVYSLLFPITHHYGIQLNIVVSLALGLLAIHALHTERWGVLAGVIGVVVLPNISLQTVGRTPYVIDYGLRGLLLMLAMHLVIDKSILIRACILGGILAFPWLHPTEPVIEFAERTIGLQGFAILSLPILLSPVQTRLPRAKWFFYIYYPAHLLVIWVVMEAI